MSIRGEKTFCDPGERQSRRNVSAGKLICWGMEKDFIHSRPGIQGGGAIGGNSFELEGCIDRMQPFLICSSKEKCTFMATQTTGLTSDATEFSRDVTLFGGISILAGIMIGSGVFYLGSYVLIRSGMSMGLALIVWIVGGLVTLLSGLCYAELGTMMPKAGGGYVYLREAFGERVAYMSGMSTFIIGSSGSIAGLAIALPQALTSIFPMTELQCKLFAVLMVVLLTAVNYRGVKFGAAIQNVFMIGKLIPLVLIIICGIAMGQQTPDLTPVPAGGASIGEILSMVAFGVVATLWAFEGWTNLNTISEEIQEPRKNIPQAIIISILAVTALYVLFNFSIYRVLSFEDISAHIAAGDYFLGTAAANTLFGHYGKIFVAIAMAVAIFGALNGSVMVFPRTYYAMAKDGMFFPSFTKLHPKYHTPTGAIIASMIVSCLLIFANNLDQITSLVVFSGMIFKSLTFASVIVLRKKYPDMNRPYKVWFYPFSVFLIVLIMIGLCLNTLLEDPRTSLIGLIVPLFGLAVYEFQLRRKKKASR